MPTVKTWVRRSIRAETAYPANESEGSAGEDKTPGVATETGSALLWHVMAESFCLFFRKRTAVTLPNFLKLEEKSISIQKIT